MHPTDHIQIVTFRLAGIDADAYSAHCEAVAPRIARLPGLRAKGWLADARTNTYGGVYAWDSREAMEDYVQGPIFSAVRANPHFADVTVRDFALLPRPTSLTQRRPELPLAPRDSWAA